MAKTIGLIRSKNDKKVFFLPDEVKKLTLAGYQVFCHSNYGKYINIVDQKYVTAGAKIVDSAQKVINNSEVILLTSNIHGLSIKKFANKIVISLTNMLNNLKMIECFVHQKTLSLQWLLTNDKKQFALFNNLEKLKNTYVFDLIKSSKKPIKNIALIHGTPACQDLARELLKQNYNVKLFVFNDDLEFVNLKKQFAFCQGNQLSFYRISPETFNDDLQLVDCIVNMSQNPERITCKIFTNELTKMLKKRTMLIDLSSENGLCATFIHHYSKSYRLKRYYNILFSGVCDLTNCFAVAASKCISCHSIDIFLEMLQKDSFKNSNLVITKDGQIVHPWFIAKLHIF